MHAELDRIFSEPFVIGIRPRDVTFSPDGEHIAFLWNSEGRSRLTLHVTRGRVGGVATDSELTLDGYCWDAHNRVVFWRDNIVGTFPGETRSCVLEERVLGVETTRDRTIAITPGAVWSLDLDTGRSTCVHRPNAGEIILAPRWSDGDLTTFGSPARYQALSPRDGRIAIVVWTPDPRSTLATIDYLAESTNPRVQADFRQGNYHLEILGGGDPLTLAWPKGARLYSVGWSHNGEWLAVDLLLADRQSRTISVVDPFDGSRLELYREKARPWHGALAKVCAWSPTRNELLITSERTGYNHAYLLPLNGQLRSVTDGPFEVKRVSWESNGDELALIATVRDPAAVDPWRWRRADSTLHALVPEPGVTTELTISATRAAFVRSTLQNGWGLVVHDVQRQTESRAVTPMRSVPFLTLQPEIAEMPGPQGPLRALIYRPDSERSRGAGILFVHGNGFLQDVLAGQSPFYWREHLFNRFLARSGYFVVSVDYSGSEGYGFQHATRVVNGLGMTDLADVCAARDWMLSQGCDAERIGLYGGSYGGYLVIKALLQYPSRFACGAALRAVTDWRSYWQSDAHYTEQRLGADLNAAVYDTTSTLVDAATLCRPLLLLHGLQDDNVPFSHIAHLLDRIQRSGRGSFLDLMVYPGEKHSFQEPTNWRDEYERVTVFFEKWLKK